MKLSNKWIADCMQWHAAACGNAVEDDAIARVWRGIGEGRQRALVVQIVQLVRLVRLVRRVRLVQRGGRHPPSQLAAMYVFCTVFCSVLMSCTP